MAFLLEALTQLDDVIDDLDRRLVLARPRPSGTGL
jgi:hypothetical protein